MKISHHASLRILLCVLVCLVFVSGCTIIPPLKFNDTPPALITDVQTKVLPVWSTPVAGGACAEGQTPCSGVCRYTLVDSSNCGRCGNVCSTSQHCSNGVCTTGTANLPVTRITTVTPAGGMTTTVTLSALSCPTGYSPCNGICRNLESDISNCGRCGNVCGSGLTCSSGTCYDGSTAGTVTTTVTTVPAPLLDSVVAVTTTTTPWPACPSGTTRCGGSCVDTNTDNNNCYGCGNVCRDGRSCVAGICSCPAGLNFCDYSCIDFSTNRDHCGRCYNACSAGQSCIAGICRCPAGFSMCDYCTDLQNDNHNCGDCGISCVFPFSCCNGACRNLNTDMNNCAVCGNICFAGQHCSGVNCVCDEGTILCGSNCYDPFTSDANCGGCGIACPTGQHCSAGYCVDNIPVVVTTTSSGCGKEQTLCSSGKSGSVCTDLKTDDYNCGFCGNVCTGGTFCSGGNCGYVVK